MAEHMLKTWPEFFRAMKAGTKTFEVRADDRDFEAGDRLVLLEYDPETAVGYTGEEYHCDVTYVLRDARFTPPGSVIMAIAPAPEEVAQLIADALLAADQEWGFSIELTRLVDGERTYTLRMPGFKGDFPDYDEASEVMQVARAKQRASRVLAALRGDTFGKASSR